MQLLVHLVLKESFLLLTLLPKPLSVNSTIGLVCLAGGFDDYKTINQVIKYLSRLGYKVKLGKSIVPSEGFYKYLSGPDSKRINDLISFWCDKNVDAIFCLRGGYGTLRLLQDIDFNLIKKYKKIIIGFSDITVLLLSIFTKTSLITFHGPMLGIKQEQNSIKKMLSLLHNPKFHFSYQNKSNGITIHKGKAYGKLIGGNLSNICSMLESGYLPNVKDAILFLEDCNEEPYKIDRLLTQLENAKIFKQVSGLIFSSFYKCKFKNEKEIITLIKNKTSNLKIPIIYNFPIGHGKNNFAVPIGMKVMLDADNKTLKSTIQ